MTGPFSATVLEGLLDHGIEIAGVVTPAPRTRPGLRALPVLGGQADDIENIAYNQQLPCLRVQDFDAKRIRAQVRRLAPDIIVVACFPKKIPASFVALAPLGGFNLHPSLLPRYRGPIPLFWQFRDGRNEFGITLHRLSNELDGGDIALQRAIAMPDGISGAQANRLLAQEGANMISDLLRNMAEGRLVETPQDESLATCQGWPQRRDFHLSPMWTARRAWNFIKGTRHWRQPYTIEYPETTLSIDDAIGYTLQRGQANIIGIAPNRQLLRFSDGSLLVGK